MREQAAFDLRLMEVVGTTVSAVMAGKESRPKAIANLNRLEQKLRKQMFPPDPKKEHQRVINRIQEAVIHGKR